MKRLTAALVLLLFTSPLWAEWVGDYAADATVYCPFMTYGSNGELITATALAAADVEIYKSGGTTQRASDAGITVSADFDTVTGQHLVSIDTSDNTDAGFYTSAPTYYQVFIQPFTVNAQTTGTWCAFSLGAYATTAEINTEVDTALSDVGLDHLVGVAVTGTDVTDNSIIAKIVGDDATADWDTFNNTTDSLEALNLLIAALNDLSAAAVNAEVVDVLKTDTITLPAQGAPPATPTFEQALSWLYKVWRNLKDNDGTTVQYYNDAGTVVDHKRTVSEAAGTVTEAEVVSGP